jgi:2-keto-4-pentenoate hydratase
MIQNKTSAFLLQHANQQTRCAGLPDALRPKNKTEAYAAQAHIETQSREPLVAWKIAATSAAGQKHIGVSGPLVGRYIAERTFKPGSTIRFGNNHMKVAEVEFAFKFADDIAPRPTAYSETEALACVTSLHPAIEVPDSRYERFELVGELQLIADNACADWLSIGEAFPDDWRDLDLAQFEPVGRIKGKSETRGKGSNVLGSPVKALTWFINEMSALGITIRKGQYVSTGTCIIPMAITAGDTIEGDFEGMGSITVTMGQ